MKNEGYRTENLPAIGKALDISARTGKTFIGTCGSDGIPHIALGGRLSPGHGDNVTIEYWFCPESLENLRSNPGICIVCWDPAHDEGIQLAGTAERVGEVEEMDGLAAGQVEARHLPQVERRIVVRVDSATDFGKFEQEKR